MYALVIVAMLNNTPSIETVWLYRGERECKQNAAAAPKAKTGPQFTVKCVRVATDDPIVAHGIEALTLPDVVEPVPHDR
jgi:hypothetical protein